MNNQFSRRSLIQYTSYTFFIFWILLGITGVLIYLKVPVIIQDIMKNVCAWSPTFAILILFRKIYPGLTLKEHLKTNFQGKIKASSFISGFILQFAVLFLAIALYLLFKHQNIASLHFITISAIIPVLLMDIISGATGEELGWRVFMLREFQKKYSLLISSLLTGFIWGIWHFPLWLLSGYSGMNLVIYIFAFMTSILSFSIIISYFYVNGNNILIAMWLHLLFNFSLKIIQVDLLQLLGWISVSLSLTAIVLIVLKRKIFFQNV